MTIKPPFPWFGGKSKIGAQVWVALGDVQHYVEPFFGSGAVLFARPTPPKTETVNDLDHYIANFWRAVQHDPAKVAEYADNPVNEDDLTARHIWLVKHAGPELASRIPADPEYFDAKVAGWWVWGICCWIGGSWCAGNGPWTEIDGELVNMSDKTQAGVSKRRVHLGNGRGVKRQLDELTNYITSLSDRLRNVRVCSGDWSRVVTNGALSHGDPTGVFLDPPYDMGIRDDRIYNHDTAGLAQDVLAWCKANGSNKKYRIALAGYDGEHNDLEKMGWFVVSWKAGASYQTAASKNDNRKLERIWFSPHCIRQAELF